MKAECGKAIAQHRQQDFAPLGTDAAGQRHESGNRPSHKDIPSDRDARAAAASTGKDFAVRGPPR